MTFSFPPEAKLCVHLYNYSVITSTAFSVKVMTVWGDYLRLLSLDRILCSTEYFLVCLDLNKRSWISSLQSDIITHLQIIKPQNMTIHNEAFSKIL